MRVKAKFQNGKFGFYGGQRRRNGDEFDIEPDHFSEKWMVNLEDEKPKRGRPVKQAETIEDGAEQAPFYL